MYICSGFACRKSKSYAQFVFSLMLQAGPRAGSGSGSARNFYARQQVLLVGQSTQGDSFSFLCACACAHECVRMRSH